MAKTKKYYWLRLQEDFFSSPRMKKLRKIAGGDTYVIIYLKMQLMSIKTDGVIRYEGVEETFAEELALILDEEPENVEIVIAFLKSHNLLEEYDENSFFMPEVAQNIGKESESAERVRAFRQRKAEKALQCNTAVTESNTEERKGKEIREEKIREEKRIGEEKEISLFLSLYSNLFSYIFKKEPNKSHLTAVKNLYINGKSQETILKALESAKGKQIDEPEPYVYSVIKAYKGGELNGTECKGNTGHDDNKYGLNVTVL